ncbi:Retrovirus-related Pol polyprotein, partial [Mucuna pruriens]
MELKLFLSHLKYAYLDTKQQLPVIIANNLHQEQEDKLLHVLRQHKKEIRWKLSNLPSINPSIYMHRILMKEEAKPIRQQQRRLNLTIIDVVKKEATHKDHFPLPFNDQVLEKLVGKFHYYFLDGFSGYMQFHIVPEDQHKTTFTCPFATFAYTRMPFGLCNTSSTFQHCMTSIFSDLLQDCMECHFMVTEGIVLGHLVCNRGIEVDKSKIDIITSLPTPLLCGRFAHSWDMQGSIEEFQQDCPATVQTATKDVDFKFDQPCVEAFQELKNQLTSAPILQAHN